MSNFVRHLIVKKYARLESPKLSIITLKNYTPLRSAGSNETKTRNTEKRFLFPLTTTEVHHYVKVNHHHRGYVLKNINHMDCSFKHHNCSSGI